MKLSIENHVIRKTFGDEKAIEMIAQAGFDAMDFSFYWMPKAENILDREDRLDYANRLRALADRHGLAVTQAHAPFDLKLTDAPEKQAYDYDQIRRSIEFSGILGVKQIIVHNLTTANPADFIDTNLAFFRSLEDVCSKSGVRVAVENLWSMKDGRIVGGRLSTARELGAFLDRLNPEHFCGCIDLGHAEIVDEDSASFIRGLGTPRLHALHVQDTDLTRDSHMLPYLGKHNWAEITRALAEVRYEGDLTFEIFAFLNSFPKEALSGALRFAHTIGRGLIGEIDKASAQA